MWIKLCGNTSLEDARLGVASGADALGFIFAKDSKRYVGTEKAASICAVLARESPQVERVGVFTRATAEEMAAIASDCALTAVQLQSQQTQEEAAKLRAAVPHLVIIAAFPWAGGKDFARRLASHIESPVFDRFLVDSSSAHTRGGTGEAFAWEEAAGCFADALSQGLPVIAAGGLSAKNVTAAVTVLRPFGVDAVSSLEASPGVKDAARVAAFVAAARGNLPLAFRS
jgi:phosphoribosylanthranilate isomerase